MRESRIKAGSLPPSSTQTGVRDLDAEAQTVWAMGREPMNVMWDMPGWEVRWFAVAGHMGRDWMRWGECEQAERAWRAMETK